jgi:hypothetical protein
MRLNTYLAVTLSAIVVVAWFLWPYAAVPRDPAGSALAALRAVTLFAVTLGATNVIADGFPRMPPPVVRSAIGLGIAFSIGVGVSIGLRLFAGSRESSLSWWALLVAAAADAFWCAVAMRVYYLLTRNSFPRSVIGRRRPKSGTGPC